MDWTRMIVRYLSATVFESESSAQTLPLHRDGCKLEPEESGRLEPGPAPERHEMGANRDWSNRSVPKCRQSARTRSAEREQ